MKFLDWLFGGESQPKRVVKNPEDKELEMVEEPVISFVKCLKSDPKRFKVSTYSEMYAENSGKWPPIYTWMRNRWGHTGYYKLTDRKEGDEYYAIIYKGEIYSVSGLEFSLNAWERRYIMKSFYGFRQKAKDRKLEMVRRKMDKMQEEQESIEKLERAKLMEKFQ